MRSLFLACSSPCCSYDSDLFPDSRPVPSKHPTCLPASLSGLGRLRRLVFDVRGWPQAPDQTGLEAFLETVLDCFVNSNDSLQSLVSIHAVLEDGPYSPSKNNGYLAQEGPLGAWGAVRDEYGEMWVAMLCEEQRPKVILMHQLATADASSDSGDGEGEEGWSSDGSESE
jgi:hypothetical protein